jgi:hypothetical protein
VLRQCPECRSTRLVSSLVQVERGLQVDMRVVEIARACVVSISLSCSVSRRVSWGYYNIRTTTQIASRTAAMTIQTVGVW